MARRMKCTFKRVNGDQTGVFCRVRMTKNSKSPGILYMRNCKEGKYFYVDPDDGGTNQYYKLINPGEYRLPNQPMYVFLDNSFIASRVIENIPAPRPPATPVVTQPAPTQRVNEAVVYPKRTYMTKEDITVLSGDNSSRTDWSSGTGSTSAGALRPDPLPGISSKKPVNQYSYGSITRNSFLNDYTFMKENLKIVQQNLNIPMSASEVSNVRSAMINKFNRFKTAFPDMQLTKTFPHIFFTRPELNLYASQGSGNSTLLEKVSADPVYYYLDKNNPDLLRSLTKGFSSSHQFNPFLSNSAQSFELSDEFIQTTEYGETFTGWKVKYGKNNIESKTAGNFSISYADDDEYRVYKIHKAWVDYISKVFRGQLDADSESIKNRELDYAVSVYYFLCGADGETILFWSKYTGVFPTSIPSSTSSWSKGSMVKFPEFTINYDYAWKEDFDPLALGEFNNNSSGGRNYQKIYEPELTTTGRTFTNAPFIESTRDSVGSQVYKLKFRQN